MYIYIFLSKYIKKSSCNAKKELVGLKDYLGKSSLDIGKLYGFQEKLKKLVKDIQRYYDLSYEVNLFLFVFFFF